MRITIIIFLLFSAISKSSNIDSLSSEFDFHPKPRYIGIEGGIAFPEFINIGANFRIINGFYLAARYGLNPIGLDRYINTFNIVQENVSTELTYYFDFGTKFRYFERSTWNVSLAYYHLLKDDNGILAGVDNNYFFIFRFGNDFYLNKDYVLKFNLGLILMEKDSYNETGFQLLPSGKLSINYWIW